MLGWGWDLCLGFSTGIQSKKNVLECTGFELSGTGIYWNFFIQVDFMVAADMQWAMRLDALVTSHPIYIKVNHPDEINEIFDSISYHKVKTVL